MIAIVATLSGVALAALLTTLGFWFKRSMDAFKEIRDTVAKHETTDQLVIQRLEGQDKRMDRVDDSLMALNNKADRILERLPSGQQAVLN